MILRMSSRRISGGRAALLAIGMSFGLGAAGCVESSVHAKTTADLEEARRAAAQKDQQLRAFEWQLGGAWQQMQAMHQKNEAAQRELAAQVHQLSATNAQLADRLKKAEAQLAAAPPEADDPKGKKAPLARLRPEDLRRIEATVDARNGQIVEILTRIEKLLHDKPHPPARGHSGGDVLDPWGFGSRK
jgi:chromosome segregation ATPase